MCALQTQAPPPLGASRWLRQSALRVTPSRLEVLELFLQRREGLSHAEVEAALPQFDRVTLYRTLTTLEQHQLLHRVPDAAGLQRFALGAEHQGAPHPHFQCLHCGKTQCLEAAAPVLPALPVGYEALRYEYVVQGICALCHRGAVTSVS